MTHKVLLNSKAINIILHRLACELIENHLDFSQTILIGISYDDNRIFYWLILNSVLILALQPVLMRISRTLWLAMIVKYDPDWKMHPAEIPERTNEEQKDNW